MTTGGSHMFTIMVATEGEVATFTLPLAHPYTAVAAHAKSIPCIWKKIYKNCNRLHYSVSASSK